MEYEVYIAKNDRYSVSSTKWTLVSLNFTGKNMVLN